VASAAAVISGLGTKMGRVVVMFSFDGCHVPMRGQRPCYRCETDAVERQMWADAVKPRAQG
jgi:hypothetical protein